MVGEEDALFRPVLRGLLKAESLLDGSVDLDYILLLNEAIEIEQENDRRAAEHEKRQRQGGK